LGDEFQQGDRSLKPGEEYDPRSEWRSGANAGLNVHDLDVGIFCVIDFVREILRRIEVEDMLDTIVSLAVCAALLVYLVYAMLRPEKF
jgi:K+-transporting ATPase KdpF subunit